MTKTPEELMQPRIIVENNYPRSPYRHHEIIVNPTEEQIAWAKEFTVNFRFLNWWEHRSPEEMPEYLMRTTKDKKVFKAIRHNVSATHGLGFVCEHGRTLSYCNYLPATHEEYTNYITTTPSLPGENNKK